MPARTAAPTTAPRGAYSGHLATAFGLFRAGRLRLAVSELVVLNRRAAERTLALSPDEQAESLALLLQIRLAMGDVASALDTGDALTPFLDGDGPAATVAQLASGELADAQGDHEMALKHYLAAGRRPPVPGTAPWQAGAAVAMVRTGQRKQAAATARDLLAAAETADDSWTLAVALRTLATADASADPFGTLRRAREAAREAGDARLSAQIDADLAGLLVLVPAGDGLAQAVDLLRQAEAYASSEGLWPLHSRISRLLGHAGERTRPLEGDALAVLTSAEQRVARLAAQGLTNRQIAEELEVSVKGVEWHLSRVYRKLGIASRDGLGTMLDVAVPPRPRSATA